MIARIFNGRPGGGFRKRIDPQPTFVGSRHVLYRVAPGHGAVLGLATTDGHPGPPGER